MDSSTSQQIAWPRDFRVVPPISARAKFWSHELYRGTNNQPVKILYSRTKMQSEEIAHEFLGESVIGFDMEWPWQDKAQDEIPLQQRIGLIQIATEDKIALFHIGLHAGSTAKDVLAPTLRHIIESENITKTGVGILNADFSRLHRWFGLTPRGAFELSHFHNLVTYGASHPIKVTTKMKALSKLVEEHLGLPLYKGKVRTSNWSRPLNQAQILYAAADAYAGFMLYHCMNAGRLAMDPAPPLPLHAEIYLPMRQGMGSIIPVQLGSSSKDTSGISAVEFYTGSMGEQDQSLPEEANAPIGDHEDEGVGGDDEEGQENELLPKADVMSPSDQAALPAATGDPSAFEDQATPRNEDNMGLIVVGRRGRQLFLEQQEMGASSKVPETRLPEPAPPRHTRETASKPTKDPSHVSQPTPNNPEATKALLERLRAHRKSIAKERKCAAFVIAHNTLLSAISEKCPRNEQELCRIKGIGKVKAELYGPAWLGIVRDFLEERTVVTLSDNQGMASPAILPTTPTPRQTRRETAVNEASSAQTKTPAVLHTGLSFSMENATLETETDQKTVEISDESSAIGSPIRSPSPSTLKRKRGLLDSSSEFQTKQRPVLPQPALFSRGSIVNAPAQPDLQATFNLKESATAAKKTSSLHTEIMPNSPARPQQAAPSQIFSPHWAPQAAGLVPKTQTATQAQIFRNKLLAFNRRVTSTFILSEATIEHIIQSPPKTAQELLQIPNILPFANACARQNQCLLNFILKSTQEPASSVY